MEGGHFRPKGTVVLGTSGFGALELLAKRHGRCFKARKKSVGIFFIMFARIVNENMLRWYPAT
jgi:hypothetical protein